MKRRDFLWMGIGSTVGVGLLGWEAFRTRQPVAVNPHLIGTLELVAKKPAVSHYEIQAYDLVTKSLHRVGLPFRGHSAIVHPLYPGRVVVFGKRQRTAAEVDFGAERWRSFEPARGGEFYGHGVFSTDGATLFDTEIADENSGTIQIRDARSYAVLGELPSFGRRPHDIHLVDGGRVLVVANAGAPLQRNDLPAAERTNVAFIEIASGKLLEQWIPEGTGFEFAHLEIGAQGEYFVSTFPNGPKDQWHIGAFVGTRGQGVSHLPLPADIEHGLRDQLLSMAYCARLGTLAVTSPESGCVLLWNTRTREFAGKLKVRAPSGLVVDPSGERFILSGPEDGARLLSASDLSTITAPPMPVICNAGHLTIAGFRIG